MALKSEETICRLFNERGYNEAFDFVGKINNGKETVDFAYRCKRCGAISIRTASYYLYRYHRIICNECGTASDGNGVWSRSPECESAMQYYQQGHSVAETAEKFGVSAAQINNAVRYRGLTNGKDFREESKKVNQKRMEIAGRGYPARKCHSHIQRAKRFGVPYEYGITLRTLLKEKGLRCAICGGLCDMDDKTWGDCGPLYPSIDHIIPLAKGGGHTWNNIQVSHMMCNSIKGDKI